MRSFATPSLLAVASLSTAWGLTFTARRPTLHRSTAAAIPRNPSSVKALYMSEKEDEIAALEEKLRQLKEVAVQEKTAQEEQKELAETEGIEDVPEVYEEMLSEQWKASEAAEEGGGLMSTVTTVLGVVASLVFLGFFSQVPVGQEDLSKYSTGQASTRIDLGDLNPVKSVKDAVYNPDE
mmetsp:Transcript_33398/g.68178  ORF Transcript_33398/g.68178 Transcript_33398/m.68178 type:complete len:180 (-) Transcript_33398:147-686(-)